MKRFLFVASNPWTAWGGSEKLWVYTAKYLLANDSIKAGVLIRKWDSIEPVLGELFQVSTVFQHQSKLSIINRSLVRPVEIWKTNHALVLPSRYEGLPIALVEAMLCGRFGIVTNVSGNVEVVENNVNGFIAEAPKTVYLDGALERAWVKRDQWGVIGQKARSFIRTVISRDPIADYARVLMTAV
jgi:glycosyltransferase involved in cell wall biosynthesis